MGPWDLSRREHYRGEPTNPTVNGYAKVVAMNVPDWFHGLTSALDVKMGMVLEEVTPTRAVARYPVAGNTQPFGMWHGGASCVVAETLASLAAAAEVGPKGLIAGVDINATHLLPVSEGWVTGIATALRIGGTLATYDVAIIDDDDRQVCAARITVHLKRAAGSGL